MDISYFESGYIVESYFTRIANAEVNLTARFTGYCQNDYIGFAGNSDAELISTSRLQVTGNKVYRITPDALAVTQTNTGGASAFDGVSPGLGLTTYQDYGILKIDANQVKFKNSLKIAARLDISYFESGYIVDDYFTSVPSQQPYLDYGQDNRYGTWKTIDFWVYVNSLNSNLEQYPIASQYLNNSNFWSIYLQTQAGGNKPYVVFQSSDTNLNATGIVTSKIINSQGSIIPGQWNHIRILRNTGVGTIYINGQQDCSGNTFTAPTQSLPSQGNLTIGHIGDGYESDIPRSTDYWIEELTLNFNPLNSPSAPTITVPTEPWFSTDTTLLLLHFNYNYFDDATVPITTGSSLEISSTLLADVTKSHFIDESAIIESTAMLGGPTVGLDAIGTIILAVPRIRTIGVLVGNLNA